jgi:hypothetical protein
MAQRDSVATVSVYSGSYPGRDTRALNRFVASGLISDCEAGLRRTWSDFFRLSQQPELQVSDLPGSPQTNPSCMACRRLIRHQCLLLLWAVSALSLCAPMNGMRLESARLL